MLRNCLKISLVLLLPLTPFVCCGLAEAFAAQTLVGDSNLATLSVSNNGHENSTKRCACSSAALRTKARNQQSFVKIGAGNNLGNLACFSPVLLTPSSLNETNFSYISAPLASFPLYIQHRALRL
jgi:hypothetical protein